MSFRINTNVAALNAHTSSLQNNRNLSNSLAKLSSGLRINKAADDASGLAIANSLRAQASSLGQAINNGNDAIGLIQTADGALKEYSDILDTIKTKAVQAASDGQNTNTRLAIQKDIDKLMEQLDTIAKTTSFNGQKLLSGTYQNKEFQMGANSNESAKVSIASTETSQIGQTSRARLDFQQIGENQLSIQSAVTGKTLELETVDIQYNNDTQNGMGAVADQINRYSGETGISAKAIIESSTGTISAGVTGADFAINGINIGAINVSANDADGTLVNAINSKTTQTGVQASKNEDGTISLSSDGRAIKVEGDLSGITTTKAEDLTTIGHLEVVQAGSSTFQIKGVDMAAAVGNDITISGTMTALQDSVLEIGSTIQASSTLAAGTVIGGDITVSSSTFGGNEATAVNSASGGTLAVGSTLITGTILAEGTTLTSKIEVDGDTALTSSMTIKAGSTLEEGTIFDAGTVLQQDMKISGSIIKAGTTLTVDKELDEAVVLTKDMVMHLDSQNKNATIGDHSVLVAGTTLGADITLNSGSTLSADMEIKAGTVLASGSTIKAGSSFDDEVYIHDDFKTTAITELKTGSTLGSGSVIAENSTLGGEVTLNGELELEQDMLIKEGSVLTTGSILKTGTVLQQDLSDAQVGGGAGSGLKAGTVLGDDITLTDKMYVTKDFTMLKGAVEDDGYGKLAKDSVLAANAGEQNSVVFSNEEFTNLADIDVTTLEGAMKAMDTLDAAIRNLDTIRSDLGSVQNQVTSTINNISVTQVNVKAAESNIRDVDFAAESASFSKFNILAQSGSYAMSQANAVQQNVLRLLQ